VVDTEISAVPEGKPIEAGGIVPVAARALVVLQSTD
jgi:hypothetical protein